MYKLLPTVLRDFEFELQTNKMPGGEWRVWAGWFHQQKDVLVKVKRRRDVDEKEKVVVDIDESWGAPRVHKT